MRTAEEVWNDLSKMGASVRIMKASKPGDSPKFYADTQFSGISNWGPTAHGDSILGTLLKLEEAVLSLQQPQA